jgi:hypothetical protein
MTINIFLSHASEDAAFAILLASEIEREFTPNVKVFASSRPNAIPSGTSWLDDVLKNLDKADVLVILITTASESSIWVSFELGYFWKETGGRRIHTLYHPKAKIPNPLNTLQAKLVTDKQQLQDFFQVLCQEIGHPLTNTANLGTLVNSAHSLSKSPPQRSLANFERLLETSEWDEVIDGNRKILLCADDMFFQIVIDWDSREDFAGEWTRPFPDSKSTKKYPVKLTIAGVTVKVFYFISVDGGRYFIPMPDIGEVHTNKSGEFESREFIWKRDSLIFKVAEIISEFLGIYSSLEAFATHTGIKII